MTKEEKESAAFEVLGMCGAMLSGSKQGYDERNPGHLVFYNANIFDIDANKVWFGDIDLTKQIDQLQKLTSTFGEDIYVTREQPFRFDPPSANKLNSLADRPHSGVVRIVFAPAECG